MKLTKQTVKLFKPGGAIEIPASVTPSGMWALYKDESGYGKPTYSLSHVPTGVLARNKIPTLAAVKELAEAAEGMEMPILHSMFFGYVPKHNDEKLELFPLRDKILAMVAEKKL